MHTVLILLDAEEADSINSHGREKRNDVVLVRAVARDETATVVTLSGASGTESVHQFNGPHRVRRLSSRVKTRFSICEPPTFII